MTLAAVGGHVTQGRAVGNVDGREILTVNAALGQDELAVGGVWVRPPDVPPPDECPPRYLPEMFRNTIMDSVEVRQARTHVRGDGRDAWQPGLRSVGEGAWPPDTVCCHARHHR